MSRTRAWLLLPLSLALIATLSRIPTAWAADPPATLEPSAAAAESAAPEAATDKEKDKDKTLREQSIYIPYEKLRKVFEKEGRGVFLPYKEFQDLWQAAQAKTARTADLKPPIGALISESENEATVAKDVVRVKATLKIEVLAEGWNEIPLGLADAAITSAKLGGQPARIVSIEGQGYKLLVEHKGKKPESLELSLEYAKAIQRMPGQNSVSFQAPQTPVSRWKVRIPEAGVKVNLSPLIAATEVNPAEEKQADEKGDKKDAKKPEETVVLAFVGAAPTVRIDWTPKAEGATGLEALASVQAEQQVSVDEGVIRTRTQLAYTISRAQLAQLAIEVPADQKVANVFDANVRQWSVEKAEGKQTISVQLFEPAKGSQNVTVELERFLGENKENKLDTLSVPVVKAVGVGRQQGLVVVQIAEGLRAETAKTTGLLQVDSTELSPALAKGHWAFAYRYVAVPYDLVLSLEKVKPRILADSLVEAELTPEGLLLDVLTIYTIERAGVFRVEMDLPAGFEVRQVRGADAAGAAAVQVDAHHLEGEKKTRLVVDLSRKATGRVALAVQLRKDLKEADLLTPTGKTVQIPLPLPQVVPMTVERASGRLMIYAPESLRVNPGKTDGLRAISFKEALDGMQSIRGEGKSAEARPVLAFAYTQEPTTVSLAAERRKPQVTIRQLLVARVEDGVVKYQATFFYNILYSGVKSLRIDVPAEVAPLLRNNTSTIREKVLDLPPEKLEKGYVAWSLSGETELTGDGKIDLAWENKIDKLDVGKPLRLKIPPLKPRDADRAWGQIVLVKAETIDLRETDDFQGLRPIDPQHDLMPGADVPGAAAAMEFHGPWSLSIAATRYDLKEVKQTAIERAVLRMVVTRAEKVTVQALYRMKSARQRLIVKLPKDAEFDADPRINGRAVTLEVGDGKQFYVPLVDPNPEQAFLLELRYTVPSFAGQLDTPEFPHEPAVQKVYLCVYLPPERALIRKRGPWTDEFSVAPGAWSAGNGFAWPITNPMNDSQLLDWVKVDAAPGEFPVDGQLYTFSTLHPSGPLRIATVDRDWLHGVVVALVLLGGVVLLPARAGLRSLAIGVAVIVLVLLGVFWPIFAWQVMGGIFGALALVLAVWVVWHFVRTVPKAWNECCGRWAQRRAKRSPQRPPADLVTATEVPAGETPPASPFSQPPAGEAPKADRDQGGQADA